MINTTVEHARRKSYEAAIDSLRIKDNEEAAQVESYGPYFRAQ